jgi:hypothetical protein
VSDNQMTEVEVIELMETSQTEQEWNENCDIVKAAFGGYPSFWWQEIKLSGLMARVTARWGSDDQIHIEKM